MEAETQGNMPPGFCLEKSLKWRLCHLHIADVRLNCVNVKMFVSVILYEYPAIYWYPHLLIQGGSKKVSSCTMDRYVIDILTARH